MVNKVRLNKKFSVIIIRSIPLDFLRHGYYYTTMYVTQGSGQSKNGKTK